MNPPENLNPYLPHPVAQVATVGDAARHYAADGPTLTGRFIPPVPLTVVGLWACASSPAAKDPAKGWRLFAQLGNPDGNRRVAELGSDAAGLLADVPVPVPIDGGKIDLAPGQVLNLGVEPFGAPGALDCPSFAVEWVPR